MGNLRKLAIVLSVLVLAGLVADYIADKENFPDVYTLFPLCLLIVNLLVMLVIWLFRVLVNEKR